LVNTPAHAGSAAYHRRTRHALPDWISVFVWIILVSLLGVMLVVAALGIFAKARVAFTASAIVPPPEPMIERVMAGKPARVLSRQEVPPPAPVAAPKPEGAQRSSDALERFIAHAQIVAREPAPAAEDEKIPPPEPPLQETVVAADPPPVEMSPAAVDAPAPATTELTPVETAPPEATAAIEQVAPAKPALANLLVRSQAQLVARRRAHARLLARRARIRQAHRQAATANGTAAFPPFFPAPASAKWRTTATTNFQ